MQGVLELGRRGGKRVGAGRKPVGRKRVSHAPRFRFVGRRPVHITLRVLDGVGRLRNRRVFAVLRKVLAAVAEVRRDFRVVHLSLQGNHLHLICEADSRSALTRGMQGLKISLARRLNAALGRSGEVFADRYHEEFLETPTQVRNCLAYVLNNWREHNEARGATTIYDPFSTGGQFTGWREKVVATTEPVPVLHARTWLLSTGWRRLGAISALAPPSGSGPKQKNLR